MNSLITGTLVGKIFHEYGKYDIIIVFHNK
jgi:hypothetical protein